MKGYFEKVLKILLVFVILFTYVMPVYAVGDSDKNSSSKNISLTDKVIGLKDNSGDKDFNYKVNVSDSINLIYNANFNKKDYFLKILKEKVNDNNINITINKIEGNSVKYTLNGYNDSYSGEFTYENTLTLELSDTKKETVVKYFKDILGDVDVNVDDSEDKVKVTINGISESFDVVKKVNNSVTKKILNDDDAKITYQGHVQEVGWKEYVNDGETGGSTGIKKGLEALRIKLESGIDGDIKYQAHVSDIGWQEFASVRNGEMIGTTGKHLSMEAIKIKLTGQLAEKYDIYYRAHVEETGWLGWTKNGKIAGTTSLGLNLEAVQIKLVKKTESGPATSDASIVKPMVLKYQAHVSDVGWQDYVTNNTEAGVDKHRLEALKLNLDYQFTDGSIVYQAHVSGIGWQNEVKNGAQVGTTGQSRAVEAIRIKLTGNLADIYDVFYRVKIQDIGWLNWAKNGEDAGSSGAAKAVYQIQVKLVKKDSEVIDPSTPSFMNATPSISYSTYSSDAWSKQVSNGTTSGSANDDANNLKAMKLHLESQMYKAKINYQVKNFNGDWQSDTLDNNEAGDINSSDGIEAIKINMSGEITKYFSVFYRTYVAGHGWLGWAKNGEPAGSTGLNAKVLAIQVKVITSDTPPKSDTLAYLSNDTLISYKAHVSDVGWQDYVNSGETAGVIGNRLEALKIKVNDDSVKGDIIYQAHVSGIGWQDEVKNDAVAGTIGKGKAVEAIRIRLTKDLEKKYDVYYRTYISDVDGYTWLGWAKNGESAGSVNGAKALQAIEIKIVNKSTPVDQSTPSFLNAIPNIKYSTYDTDWSKEASDGSTSGSAEKSSQSKGIKSLKLSLESQMYAGQVNYQIKSINNDWLGEVSDGTLAGDIQSDNLIEAVRIKLTGKVNEIFSIYYRVYIKDKGWLGWAKDGEVSGSEGFNTPIEAIQVKLVTRDTKVDKGGRAFVSKAVDVSYQAHVGKVGWKEEVKNGELAGTTGQAKPMEAVKIKLSNTSLEGSIEYMVNIGHKGWTKDYVRDGALGGTTGESLKLEGIRIKLTGEIADYFDVYYRVHVGNIGWLDWASNNQKTGTSGSGKALEAIEIKLVEKGQPAPGNTNDIYREGSLGVSSYAGITFQTYTTPYPFNELAKGFKYIDGTKYYFNPDGMLLVSDAKRIIDVSHHQGDIDWEQVKYAGRDDERDEIDGVIIRIGSYFKRDGLDRKLEQNIEGVKKYGINYGIYLYSYADNDSYCLDSDDLDLHFGCAHSGAMDAKAIEAAVDKYDMNDMHHSIFYDLEIWEDDSNRYWNYSNYEPIIREFDKQMQNYANSYSGNLSNKFRNWQIYSGPARMEQALHDKDESIWNRVTWISHYSHYLGYGYPINDTYRLWQYTRSSYVPGISGNVDSSVAGNFQYNPKYFVY